MRGNNFEFNNLRKLNKEMSKNNIRREKFVIKYNEMIIDVLFTIEEEQFSIIFFKRIENKVICFTINNEFVIDLNFKEKYYELINFLGIKDNGGYKFNPWYFFDSVDKKVPFECSQIKLNPEDLIIFFEELKEDEKIYYYGLKLWSKNSLRSVRLVNLKKTKLLLGIEAYQICEEHNISTMWKTDRNKSKDFIFNSIKDVKK